MKKIGIDRTKLLRFFDEKPDSSRGHATSIVSVVGEDLNAGLFCHYLNYVEHKQSEILSVPCTPGTKTGARLDRWIKVFEPDSTITLYQTEIKNWSSHAIGGKTLSVNADHDTIRKCKIDYWKSQWNYDLNCFKGDNVKKVLNRMKPPESGTIHPLVIYWFPLHPEGLDEPFFDINTSHSEFSTVYIFSVSSYLREIDQEKVFIEAPQITARLNWLDDLFS